MLIYSLIALFLWLSAASILSILHPLEWEAVVDEKRSIIDIAQTGGMLLGMAIGIPLEKEFIKYENRDYSFKNRIIGGIISVVVTFGFYLGLSFVLNLLPGQFIFRGIRYCLLIGIVTVGMPWIMQKLFKKIEN